MLSAAQGMLLILTILGGLILTLKQIQRRFSPHPEIVRKLLHIPMGLITLSFPWLFDRPLPVVLLAAIAITTLLAIRLYAPLRNEFGSVLGGVERRSLGEVYFPASVALLFCLAHQTPLLYCIPILILTLADALAALIGVRYGQFHYQTLEGQKSAEGSIAFFTVAFFSVHVPLLLLSEIDRAETLLISVILGLLVMLLEAIAWRGLDNFFIPLGGYLLLRTHLEMDVPALLTRLIITIALVIFTLTWRRRTTLNDSALMGAALVGYLSWSIGGWQWLLAPLTVFLCYPLLMRRVDPRLEESDRASMPWLPADATCGWVRVHNIYAVMSVVAAGALWLFLFGIWERPNLLYPYTIGFAASLAIIGTAGLPPTAYWQPAQFGRVVLYIGKSWLLLFVPLLAIDRTSIPITLLGLVGIAIAAIPYYLTQPWLRSRPTDRWNWIGRAAFATAASCLGLLIF